MTGNAFYSDFDTESLDEAKARTGAGEHRTRFQIDRDRIIHSSAFRRLQNKTQVFLSGEYDFYRTRLTHSMEVAQIGRSICDRLNKTSPLLNEGSRLDSDLIEAACLAHDLGHPPFGHPGERTLNRLMEPYGGFDGNAQTMRLLTETIFNAGRDGMNPTRGLVDAVLKYKTLRIETRGEKVMRPFLYDDQGVQLAFVSGQPKWIDEPSAAREVGCSIECQIMNWADDTAYSINDLMDGIQAGFITSEKLRTWARSKNLSREDFKHVVYLINAIRQHKIEGRLARMIGEGILACSLVPCSNKLSARTRRHSLRLVIDPAVEQKTRLYKAIAVSLVFHTPELQQLDHKADYILTRLFRALEERYVNGSGGSELHEPDLQEGMKYATSSHDSGLHLVPNEVAELIAEARDPAGRARRVCDWLANMTEGVAFRTYQRFFEPGFGSITDFV